jgi:hypothetical protein
MYGPDVDKPTRLPEPSVLAVEGHPDLSNHARLQLLELAEHWESAAITSRRAAAYESGPIAREALYTRAGHLERCAYQLRRTVEKLS